MTARFSPPILRLLPLGSLLLTAACNPGLPQMNSLAEPADTILDANPQIDLDADLGDFGEAAAQQSLGDAAESLAYPVIESFDIQPPVLPLGGGEVMVSWEGRDVAGCALVTPDGTLLFGNSSSGSVELDLEETSDLRLVCTGTDQADQAESYRTVEVEAVPEVALDTLGSKITYQMYEKDGFEASFQDGTTDQYVLNILEDTDLLLDLAPLDNERQTMTLWLVADEDGDGVPHWSEVMEQAHYERDENIDTVLEPGQYFVLVENTGLAKTYALNWLLSPAVAAASN